MKNWIWIYNDESIFLLGLICILWKLVWIIITSNQYIRHTNVMKWGVNYTHVITLHNNDNTREDSAEDETGRNFANIKQVKPGKLTRQCSTIIQNIISVILRLYLNNFNFYSWKAKWKIVIHLYEIFIASRKWCSRYFSFLKKVVNIYKIKFCSWMRNYFFTIIISSLSSSSSLSSLFFFNFYTTFWYNSSHKGLV